MFFPNFKFKRNVQPHISRITTVICIILISAQFSQGLDTCSNQQATLYDGYIEPFIAYGQFSQSSNSYFQFANPFQGINPLNSASVQFWAKFPTLSNDGSLQTGRLLDCSETISIKISNDTLKYDIASSTVNQTSGSLSVGIFKNQLPLMLQWNHYGFFYVNKTITMTVNGVVKGSQVVSQSALNSTCQTCVIGNSLNLNESINVYLRHFLFSKIAWSSSLNLTNLIHHITQPTDSNMLAYFVFGKDFNNEETYYRNSSRAFISNGLSIQQSSEPEFVCYCQGSYPNYLKMSSDFILAPINLINISNNRIDNSGLTLDFQIYPFQSGSSIGDQVLFRVQNYTDIVLTNSSSLIRVDLYNSTNTTYVNQSIYFSSYRFRFNYWTSYSINITKTNVTLFIDGIQIQSLTHKVTLRNYTNLTTNSTLFFTIQQPQSLAYLLNNVTLKNSKNVLILNNTYAQNSLQASNLSTMISSGTIKFGATSKLCSAATANLTNYWTGSNCVDKRFAPQFNNRGQTTSSLVSGIMNSSHSDQTISLWIRDLGSKSSGLQVIFENSLDNTLPLLQLSITNGNTTSSSRNISCTPYANDQSKPSLVIVNSNSYNVWNHFSCSSESSSVQTKLIYYSSQNLNYTTVSNKGQTFYDAPLGILTSIGSSINGANKFTGFIREIKIWKNAKTEYDMNIHRFQSIDTASGLTKNNLIYYFRLGDQMNPNNISDALNPLNMLLESSDYSTSIDYAIDKDLVICQPNYYYNGQCCSPFDISAATFTFAYTSSQNYFSVSLDSTTINSFLFTSMKANFSVISVGNNYQTTYLSDQMTYLQYLATLFNVNEVQKFNVSSFSVSPKAYSITLQAIIYSDLYPTNSMAVTQTITLTCPMIWLNILPNYVTDSVQTVSMPSQDYQPVVYAQVQSQCYNPLNGSVYQASVGSIKWSTVSSSVNINNAFTVSSDSYSISSVKDKNNLNGTTLKILANMTLSNKSYITNTISLYYAPIQIINNAVTLYETYNLLYTQTLTIDLTSAQSSLTSSNSGLTYQIQCPQSMFANSYLYTQLCVLSSTTPGLFTLDTSQVSAVSNYNYTFTFQIILENTSILTNIQANVQFYKDGSTLDQCPTVQIQNLYNYSISSPEPLQLIPDPYLSCNGVFYTIYSANWTISDSLSGNSLTQILVYGNQTVYRFANITSSSLGNLVPAGSLLNVKVIFSLYQNTTQQFVDATATSQIQFVQADIVPKIQVYGKNKTIIANSNVSYMEQILVLNASATNDPDNSSSILAYTWSCPDEVLLYYTCSSLSRGSYNQFLYLNALQRAKIGFLFNTSYTFGVTVSSVNNQYKKSVMTSVQVTFSPPTKTDSKNNYDMAPQCETMSAQLNNMSVYYLNSTYQRILRFDIQNFTNAAFNLSFTNTNSCKNGNVSEQIMLFYEYDNGFFQSGQPPQILYEQNTSISNSHNVLEDLSQYQISTINATQIYQTNIYWFTQRSNSLQNQFIIIFESSDNVYLNIETVYFIRNRANMVVSLSTPNVTIDKYDNLILDASQSYDPEAIQSTYAFKWTCPGNMSACSSQNTSILNVTSKDRAAGLSNANGTTYSYSVVMQDLSRSRVSQPGIAQVQISMQSNYSYCITTHISSDLFNNYWADNNQTAYFQYNQSQSINVQMAVSTSCSFINIETGVYSTAGNTVLWTTDNTAVNSINLNSTLVMKYQKPQTITTITFKQRYSLGADTSVKYYSQNYVNVVIVSPTIVPLIRAPVISYFNKSNPNQTIVFNYTNANDTISTWTLPQELGGFVLTNSTISFTNAYFNSAAISENYYNQPLQFTLNVSSTTDSRTTQRTKFLYLVDSNSSLAVAGIEQCYILNMNITSNSSQIPFNQTSVFQFSCANSKLTSQLLTNQSMIWSIDNLQVNADYYQIGQYLYLKPYRASLLHQNEVFIGLQIYTLGMIYPAKQAFKIITPELQSGSINTSPVDNSIPNIYNLQFSSFYAQYAIYFQTRAFYNIYQQYQIIFPIQSYIPMYQTTYFQSFIMPLVSKLYVDFFDANSNYIGSYDVLSSTFPDLDIKSIKYEYFESILNSITSQTNYTNSSQSLAQFESNLYTLKCLSEAMIYGNVDVDDVSIFQSYQTQILSYLINNFKSQIKLYTLQSEIAQIEIKTVYTLSNILTLSNTQIFDFMNQTLIVLEQIIKDYSDITSDNDSQEIFRQAVIKIFQILDYQVANVNQTSNGYQARLTAMKNKLIGAEQSGLSKGQSKKTLSGTTSRQTLMLYSDSTVTNQSANMTSQINSNESVYLDSQYLLSTQGASTIEVSFSVGSNDSSPAGTILYINAYDSSYTKLNLDFANLISNDTQTEYSIQYSLQATSDSQALFASVQEDGSSYIPRCVYYDETAGAWSTYGITTGTYSIDTGMLACTTSHLSTFSIDYTIQYADNPYYPPTDSSSSSSSLPSNDSDHNQPPKQNETTQYFFFQQYDNAYGAIVGVLSFIVFVEILISFITKTSWHNDCDVITKPWTQYSTKQIFKASMSLYHILLSSSFRPKKANIYMTLYSPNKVIMKWVYFFSIALTVEIVLMKSISIEWTIGQQVGLAAIIIAAVHVFRILYTTIIYTIYFSGQKIPSSSSQTFDDISQVKGRSMEYEGGSSEEEKDDEEEEYQNKNYHQSNKQDHYFSPPGKRDTLSDVHIDSIEMEIEQTNKDGFFSQGWQKKSDSIDKNSSSNYKKGMPQIPHMEIGMQSDTSYSHQDLVLVNDLYKKDKNAGKLNQSRNEELVENEIQIDTTEKNISEGGSAVKGRSKLMNTQTNMNEMDSVRRDLEHQLEGGPQQNNNVTAKNELLPENNTNNKKIQSTQPVEYKKTFWILAFFINLAILLLIMALAFYYMWLLTDVDHFHHWLGIILGSFFTLALIIDPLLILLFSIIFSSKGQHSSATKICGLLLVGNGHRNLIYGVLYQLSQ